MSDRNPPSELEWENTLQQLYRRKSDERNGDGAGIREGDPRQFRAAAAEIRAKSQGEPMMLENEDEDFRPIDNPRLIIQCWDEVLPVPFVEQDILPLQPETLKAEAVLGKVLWDILQKIGTDEAYTFLAFIAQAGDAPKPWQSPFSIHGLDLIDHLGWQRNSEKPIEQFTAIRSLIDRTSQLTVTLFQTQMEDKSTHQHTAQQFNSPFWTVLGTNYVSRLGRTSTARNSGGFYRNAYPKDLQFTLTPGQWLAPFLQYNPKQLETLVEFSRIAKGILRINPTRKKLASRLALFLTAIEPLHQSATYRVRDLLSQIESDRPLNTHYKTDETQTRLLVRWNNALRRLKLLDWVIEFDDETYPNALRPIGSLDDDDESTTIPGRFENWFSTWLEGRLMLRSSPPEIRIEDIRKGTRPLGSKLSRPKRARPSAPQAPAPIAGQTLDVALTLKGWSKAQLSYQLHMDRSMITHWIKGSRPISTEQRKKLWKILGKELLAAQKIRY